MKRGFTLLELIIVIIIIGVLATLGVQQYGRVIEKARGAEARSILGDIRQMAAAYYMETYSAAGANTTTGIGINNVGIGTTAEMIPSVCRTSHYFSYLVAANLTTGVTITATRCKATSKAPAYTGTDTPTITLVSMLDTGVDTWTLLPPY